MTTEAETNEGEQDFAAFEAELLNGPTETELQDEPKPDDEPLELTDEVKDDEDEEGEEKRRSKPASRRIAELTAKLRQAERERDEALGKGQPQDRRPVIDLVEPDPNDDKYEYGEGDPAYIRDLARYEAKLELAEHQARIDEENRRKQAESQQIEALAELETNWEQQTEKAVEKYPDFKEKVIDSAANNEWPCPPILAAGIQASPVAADVAYHLATNVHEAEAIAAQLTINPLQAAEKFGYLEGGYMDQMPERPGADAHPLDIAIYAGRMRAFVEKGPKIEPKRVTTAPTPPKHSVRGAGGKFTAGADTTDFAAFEREANAKLRAR